MAYWEAAVFQHELVRKSVSRRRGGGRAAVHWAEPHVVQLGLQVHLCVIHIVLEVAVRTIAVVLDLLAETDPLSLTRLPGRVLGAFVLLVAQKRHGPG